MGATIGDRVVTLSSIVGAICGDAADLFVHWYLTEQIGQHRGIADVAPGDLDGADLQRFLVDPEVDLAPDAPFGAAVLAGVPLTFALDLDACAVDQQMQRPGSTTVRNGNVQSLLTAALSAEVGHCPVQPDQA